MAITAFAFMAHAIDRDFAMHNNIGAPQLEPLGA